MPSILPRLLEAGGPELSRLEMMLSDEEARRSRLDNKGSRNFNSVFIQRGGNLT